MKTVNEQINELLTRSLNKPMLVLITGKLLGSTQMMNIVMQQLRTEVKVHVEEITVENHQEDELKQIGYKKLPVVLLLANGTLQFSHEGMISKTKLKGLLTSTLNVE